MPRWGLFRRQCTSSCCHWAFDLLTCPGFVTWHVSDKDKGGHSSVPLEPQTLSDRRLPTWTHCILPSAHNLPPTFHNPWICLEGGGRKGPFCSKFDKFLHALFCSATASLLILHFKNEISTPTPIKTVSLWLTTAPVSSGLLIYVPLLCFREWIFSGWEPSFFPSGPTVSLVSE